MELPFVGNEKESSTSATDNTGGVFTVGNAGSVLTGVIWMGYWS